MYLNTDKKKSHQYWMQQTLDLLKDNQTEVPVAAIIVKDLKVISKAVNQIEKLGTATSHAEIIAINKASKKINNWRLEGCILYTTLEPCSMCAGAIINSRISKVIFGAYDIKSGACGSRANLFSSVGKGNEVEIIGGIMEKECESVLKSFFQDKRTLT